MFNSSVARYCRTGTDEPIPDDLAIFQARMASHGIGVTLPTAGAEYRFPELVKVQGEPLSETVVRVRGGER